MAEEAHLSSEALPGAGSTDSGTLYPNFRRNRFLGVVFLAMGLAGLVFKLSRDSHVLHGVGPVAFQGLFDLFWVFCGPAYLQHPHTKLRAWTRRAAVASLSLVVLAVVGAGIGLLEGAFG